MGKFSGELKLDRRVGDLSITERNILTTNLQKTVGFKKRPYRSQQLDKWRSCKPNDLFTRQVWQTTKNAIKDLSKVSETITKHTIFENEYGTLK